MLSALRMHHADSGPAIKDVMVLGLVFLARNLQINPRFQPSDTQRLFNKAVEVLRPGQAPSEKSAQCSEVGESERGLPIDSNVCQYAGAEKDLHIVVEEGRKSRIQASRETMARNSHVFAAMLRGSYVESTQSEVSISDASPAAMVPVLHFLHGCGELCPVLKSLVSSGAGVSAHDDPSTKFDEESSPKSQHVFSQKQQLKLVLNVIALADRFLLPDLVSYLCAVVSTSLLDQTCVEEVLRFACFHSLHDLVEDCVRVLLLSACPVADIATCLISLAESEFGSDVTAVIATLLKRGVASSP